MNARLACDCVSDGSGRRIAYECGGGMTTSVAGELSDWWWWLWARRRLRDDLRPWRRRVFTPPSSECDASQMVEMLLRDAVATADDRRSTRDVRAVVMVAGGRVETVSHARGRVRLDTSQLIGVARWSAVMVAG